MGNMTQINRRKFLAQSAAVMAGTGSFSKKAGSSRTPIVRSISGKKLIGCLCSLDDIINHPKYIDALQKKLVEFVTEQS